MQKLQPNRMKELWNSRAAAWRINTPDLAAAAEVFNRPMLEAVQGALRTESPYLWLDLASGTGEPAATFLQSDIDIVSMTVSDFSEKMCEALEQRFVSLPQVTVAEIDMTAIPLKDGSMDVVTCRFGIMFVPDKTNALKEIGRVLSPDGLMCIVVWDHKEQNDFFAVFEHAAAKIGAQESISALVTPAFSCAGEGKLSAMLPSSVKLIAEKPIAIRSTLTLDHPVWKAQGQMTTGITTDDLVWPAYFDAVKEAQALLLEANDKNEVEVNIAARLILARKVAS